MIFTIFSILFFILCFIFFVIIIFECLFIVTEYIIENSNFIDFIIRKIQNRKR